MRNDRGSWPLFAECSIARATRSARLIRPRVSCWHFRVKKHPFVSHESEPEHPGALAGRTRWWVLTRRVCNPRIVSSSHLRLFVLCPIHLHNDALGNPCLCERAAQDSHWFSIFSQCYRCIARNREIHTVSNRSFLYTEMSKRLKSGIRTLILDFFSDRGSYADVSRWLSAVQYKLKYSYKLFKKIPNR